MSSRAGSLTRPYLLVHSHVCKHVRGSKPSETVNASPERPYVLNPLTALPRFLL
ncbi:uncharacterized protein TRIVIDRAFT_187107 [Trichoderma virens Gv29-8]|uniref:Uncharacterized protein n=1 Tax=Hypocrea virens (strain Gv29-8 / FGSC 10586) TaxID=413071 RepID=G9N4N6_HYPVG|nr:uncharacterized protein TRIVIDRAFT_187107 [Trichoderma virens Gv29-8]EHK18560.1 hypothetical protein TRIVIDRAFT_187107 [Trichoderma virens Gv29-8]